MDTSKQENFHNFLLELSEQSFQVKNKPVQLMLGLTNVCNLHCAFCPYCGFCSVKSKKVEMLPLELIENLRPYLGVAQFVTPSGRGEPLLYWHFNEFMDICRECGALSSMQLTNNGTQLQKYDVSQWREVNIIAVSIDSIDRRTFEILRNGSKLDLVLDNVKRLRRALPDTVLQWCVVVNRLNIKQLADIYVTARENGINYIAFNSVYGNENDNVIQLLRLRESDRHIVEEQFKKIDDMNSDGEIVIKKMITWSGFEDGNCLEESKIYTELERLRNQKPYLDYDKLNCNDTESRRVKSENRKTFHEEQIKIPYCTNPFCVMLIQPDGAVAPCCASYGAIDRVAESNVDKVWNGENFQLLREAMFAWDMLPDYCRKCRAFTRYDYINDYVDMLREKGQLNYDSLVIPPNYFPPEGLIKDPEVQRVIEQSWTESCDSETRGLHTMKDQLSKEEIQNVTDSHRLVARSETWDAVAETYHVSIEDGDISLADDIEKILVQHGLKVGDSLIEMGCGSGHLSACLAQKGYRVVLVDFSSVALEKAQQTFKKYGLQGEFILRDLFHLDESIPVCDFAWNSGVMEHFGDDELMTLMLNIGKYARKGILYLVPNSNSVAYLLMRARLMADDKWIYGDEYLRRDYRKILEDLGYQFIERSYITTADISAYQMWKAEKEKGNISELYRQLVDEGMLPVEEGYLVSFFASDCEQAASLKTYEGTTLRDTRVFDLVAKKIGYSEQKKQIEKLEEHIQELEHTKETYEQELARTKETYEQESKRTKEIHEQELARTKETYEQESERTKEIHEQELEHAKETYEQESERAKEIYEQESERAKGIHEQELAHTKETYEQESKRLKEIHEQELACTKETYEQESKRLKETYNQKYTEYESITNKKISELEQKATEYESACHALRLNLDYCQAILQQKNEHIQQTQELCNHFATGKLMRLNHFMFRVKGQLLKGSKADRKEFWAWIRGRIKHTNRTLGTGVIYNPWMVVNRKLQEAVNCRFTPTAYNASVVRMESTVLPIEHGLLPDLSDNLRYELAKEYTKYDVIILSVIDYNFRHQRPQHFATRFAANGHRVFYVNANFIRPDSVATESENLFVVDFSNDQHNAIYSMDGHTTLPWMKEKFDALLFGEGIRDAVVVVDYPNWVEGAEYLREKYGFKIVTDYMDDYTGFLGTAEEFLKNNCVRLLQCSDAIVASSQFLFDVAAKHTVKDKIEIVFNGTEVEHFYQAIYLETPDKKRKVIGYYGAVAHWFAWEKVCCLARKFPECDVVIVGDVTEYRAKLEQYNNIQLLGEKTYKELPKYLADFDVCLIPFDTSTDLIKATNPVKFYEYLSAGKKIVATEIPELMPYRNEYVYMSNDDDTFAEYVRLCLEGKDCLKGREECIAFARENDWQKRYEVFEKSCTRHIPKVSIVVLTYNNLTFNKQCIDSILNKTAYGNYELIVVDNASTDGTVEYLVELRNQENPGIKILLNTENKGFAGGNNVGIEAATGDYILLLNNDTVVSRGWLTALVKHLENNPRYGMCNPVTNSIGNESKIKVQYTSMEEMRSFAYIYTTEHMGEEYLQVDRLPLFATLIRRKVIDTVGMLDSSYKIGMFEDDDYAEAVKGAGYDLIIAEDVFIHHINNGSFKKLSDDEYHKIFENNKSVFERKWGKKWTMPKYREGVTAECNAECSI